MNINIKEDYDEAAKRLLLGERCFCCQFGPSLKTCPYIHLKTSYKLVLKILYNELICPGFRLYKDVKISQRELEKILKLRTLKYE